MRVIAGQWRGRRLQSPKGDRVRPTTDRVKEALFSMLGSIVRGAEVLDLCCGSGGLGIEALSRGAEHVVFVDRDRRSLDLARRNLETCRADRTTYDLVSEDAETYLAGRLATPEDQDWIVLCDPPYGDGAAHSILLRLLASNPETGPMVAVVEHSRPEPEEAPADCPWDLQHRNYGETVLTVLRRG